MYKVIHYSIVIALLTGAGILSGCAGSAVYGEKIPDTMEITKVKDILSSPSSYARKVVKVSGKIVQECPSGCWFFIHDGTAQMYIDILPAGLAIPQRVGRKVIIMGKVSVAGSRIAINGTGVEIL